MTDYIEHTFKSDDVRTTEQFAEHIGRQLRGGEVIELIGDVGAGKTTFVRGLAKGAGSSDPVSSPTFTIKNVYRGHLTIYHCDFYRLHDDTLIINELAELLDDPAAVIVLEWAQEIQAALPAEYIKIEFKVASETERIINTLIPKVYSYMEIV